MEHKLPHHHDLQSVHFMENMPKSTDFQLISGLLKQLCDESRLRIFWLLCHCEECVINISAMVQMSNPATAHHLRLLKNSGLIESRRSGKEVYYKVAKTKETDVLHRMVEELFDMTCPKK